MYYNNVLIMCASISNYYDQSTKIKKYKLHRICTLKGTTVIGGISKFNKYLLSIYKEFDYLITLSSGASTLRYYDYTILKQLLIDNNFWDEDLIELDQNSANIALDPR